MRRLSQLGVLVVAVVIGYAVAIAVSGPGGVEPSPTPAPGQREPAATSTTSTSSTSSTITATTVSQPELETYLVWTSGGLPEELVAGLAARFDRLSIVAGDVSPLDVGGGRVVPLDGVALDVEAHAPFDLKADTAALVPGTVLLGETSASYRDLGVGDSLTFAGHNFEIVGIASDDVIGAAEVVFAKSDPHSPVDADRYALVQTNLVRADFEETVRGMHDGPTPLRIRAEGETPFLRHGDAVLPQVFIKLALGEFSYPEGAQSELVEDGDFVSENIVTTEVPILGRLTCHRVVLEMLTGALDQLVSEGLSHLIDPSEFAGCWNPRFIRTVAGTPAGVSRHSWGAALDINAASNGLGSAGTQDERLVQIMADWGFIWGGDWAVPDPMHFEYGIPPGS